MNGMQLGDKKLVVQRASVGSKTMPAQVMMALIKRVFFVEKFFTLV